MKTKNYITSVFSLFCLVILATGFTWSAQEEPTVEELIRRSQQAFRQLGPIKIHFETEVKFPGSNPGIKNFCYRLGKANQALIEIGTQFRIQTSNDKLFVENLDVPDRYLEAPFNKNLAQTLALVRGRSRMAGLREPP